MAESALIGHHFIRIGADFKNWGFLWLGPYFPSIWSLFDPYRDQEGLGMTCGHTALGLLPSQQSAQIYACYLYFHSLAAIAALLLAMSCQLISLSAMSFNVSKILLEHKIYFNKWKTYKTSC